MTENEINLRFINIEMALDNQEKAIEDLSDMIIRQGKLIDNLLKQNEMMKNAINQDVVKPLSEETPPPHY